MCHPKSNVDYPSLWVIEDWGLGGYCRGYRRRGCVGASCPNSGGGGGGDGRGGGGEEEEGKLQQGVYM